MLVVPQSQHPLMLYIDCKHEFKSILMWQYNLEYGVRHVNDNLHGVIPMEGVMHLLMSFFWKESGTFMEMQVLSCYSLILEHTPQPQQITFC
jgi:hypothetical protein